MRIRMKFVQYLINVQKSMFTVRSDEVGTRGAISRTKTLLLVHIMVLINKFSSDV